MKIARLPINEPEDAARLRSLRRALIAGEKSGLADGEPFQQVREFLRRLSEVKEPESGFSKPL